MRRFLRSAFVIGRRDFMATVYTKSFIFFLLTPLLIIGISILFGNIAERSAKQDMRPAVAVVADDAGFAPIKAARERLNPAFGERTLPDLVQAEPDYDRSLQVETLLASRDKKILAVLTGGLDKPVLTGPISETGSLRARMGLILDNARAHRALARAGADPGPAKIAIEQVEESAGSLATARSMTARAGQFILFMVTVLLASMLLSNLVEEKSNKVIEVLAAAVPVDAIFVGKLFSMLAVSFVGIAFWVVFTTVATAIWSSGGSLGLPAPAVGWPLFVLLVIIYYAANYLLLGALFLGIGSQASSMREVQLMSMPVTVGQMLLFLWASVAVGPYNGLIGIAAAVFPFSSPMAMVGRAAQTPELWPHLLAILWQALWVWLTVSLAAAMFRRNVMKSGGGAPSRGSRRSKA
jgi:ABC-2 type transport system permease protein